MASLADTERRRAKGSVGEDAPPIGDPTPFDLIELTAPFAGYPVGSRGTVVNQGLGQAQVDFAWNDGGPRPDGQNHLQAVPHRSMKVICSRTFDACLDAQRAHRHSPGSARTT
jgi:hypothetical protein